jgi:hypothetical protein
MSFIYFLIASMLINTTQIDRSENTSLCTCLSYELKEQLLDQEIVSHAKILQIDTVRLSQPNWCKDEEMRKALYERKESMLKVTFKNIRTLKGALKSDTFSVISLNYCGFGFNSNYEYIVAARHDTFCKLQMKDGAVKCDSLSMLCTNECSGNSIYYEGVENKYQEALK